MTEPRKIVLILGNGFDLDLGFKTSYKDFWESDYCPKDYPAPLIHYLNQHWPNNLESVRWYDLENGLLDYYYEIVKDPTKAKDIITEEERHFLEKFTSYGYINGWYDNQWNLIESLINKGVLSATDYGIYREVHEHYKDDALQSPIWRDKKALDLIKDKLCSYLGSIKMPISEKKVSYQILHAIIKTQEAGAFVDAFTFNYTHPWWPNHNLDDIHIKYVHGSCEDGKIIIGTRDDQTIAESYDFLQKAMDDSFNPSDIVTKLREADEVVIFGHSLGENDRQYFAPFFLKQSDYVNTEKKDITIFTRDTESMREIKRAIQKMTDGRLSSFISINQPTFIRTAEAVEDQKLILKFLVNHHLSKEYAEKLIGQLTRR
ncbi:MAG: hypothetical protein IJ154_08440 [Bacteroidales bacterium]|nr:hypothetical protein [Bacteroidales bacterium]